MSKMIYTTSMNIISDSARRSSYRDKTFHAEFIVGVAFVTKFYRGNTPGWKKSYTSCIRLSPQDVIQLRTLLVSIDAQSNRGVWFVYFDVVSANIPQHLQERQVSSGFTGMFCILHTFWNYSIFKMKHQRGPLFTGSKFTTIQIPFKPLLPVCSAF